MIILAKPIKNPNPRNFQLYSRIRMNENAVVSEFSGGKLLLSKFDILHIHWPDRVFYWKSPILISLGVLWFMFLISKIKGTKIVYTCHNLFPKNKTSRFWLRLYFYVLRWGVDGVIVPRRDLVGRIRRLFPRASHEFVPLGILDAPKDSDAYILKDLFGGASQKAYILIPGIQEPTKRTELAIDKILKLRPDANIALAGKFTELAYFEFLAARYAENSNVRIFNRYLSDVQLATLIRESEFVVASQHKGTNSGIALLSVALGKACYCATSSLAAAVRRDYKTNLVWSLDDLSLKKAEVLSENPISGGEVFTMERVASQTYDFYCSILGVQ